MTPLRQLAHLVGLRWSMTSRSARVGSCLVVAVVIALGPVLALAAAGTTDRLPPEVRNQSTELLAGAYLLLLVGLVTAAVASAGGREVVPRGQLVAFPLAPRTEHLGALLLAPLNLAWLIQVLGLTLLTGAGTGVTATTVEGAILPDGSLSPSATGAVLLAVAVAWSWAFVATAAAQVLAWLVEVVRTLPGGRWWLRGAMAAAAAWALLVVDQALLVAVLDRTPTALASDRALAAVGGDLVGAALAVLVLLVGGVLLVLLGGAVHAVLARRPSRDQARQETQRHRPHDLPAPDAPAAQVRAWRRADWAGVWRSPPLRRGLVVLVIAPVAGGLLARVGWTDVVLITAVVASGAGLLFGVNAFCLDGEGAAWRESLPVPARTWLLSRGWVLTEVVLLTAVAATVAAASQAHGQRHGELGDGRAGRPGGHERAGRGPVPAVVDHPPAPRRAAHHARLPRPARADGLVLRPARARHGRARRAAVDHGAAAVPAVGGAGGHAVAAADRAQPVAHRGPLGAAGGAGCRRPGGLAGVSGAASAARAARPGGRPAPATPTAR